MNVLLVVADFPRDVGTREQFLARPSAPAIGVNHLATVLRKLGHNVVVIDALFHALRTGFRTRIDTAVGTTEVLREMGDVDCIGISITSPTRSYALAIARAAREHAPHATIVAGGPHVSVLEERLLEGHRDLYDYLVVGEGDRTLPELLDVIAGKRKPAETPGIVYRSSTGSTCKTAARPVLCEHSLNDETLVPNTEYAQYQSFFDGGRVPALAMVTARGCPYGCTFCYSPRLWCTYRCQSPERVLSEIDYFRTNYGIRHLRFQDDTFTYNRTRCLAVLAGLRSRQYGIDLYAHTRFDCIDEQVIEAYASAGGRSLYFGLESGAADMRRRMGKNGGVTNERIGAVCRAVKKAGIRLGLWVMFGYPGETDDNVQETLQLLNSVQPDEVTCNPAHVHPHTPLYHQAEEERRYRLTDWLTRSQDFFPYDEASEERVKQLCSEVTRQYAGDRIRTCIEEEER